MINAFLLMRAQVCAFWHAAVCWRFASAAKSRITSSKTACHGFVVLTWALQAMTPVLTGVTANPASHSGFGVPGIALRAHHDPTRGIPAQVLFPRGPPASTELFPGPCALKCTDESSVLPCSTLDSRMLVLRCVSLGRGCVPHGHQVCVFVPRCINCAALTAFLAMICTRTQTPTVLMPSATNQGKDKSKGGFFSKIFGGGDKQDDKNVDWDGLSFAPIPTPDQSPLAPACSLLGALVLQKLQFLSCHSRTSSLDADASAHARTSILRANAHQINSKMSKSCR